MDINNYISSGILEQYVLGDLDAMQQREVEANANQYPEIRSEIEAVEEALESIAQAGAVAPPPGLGLSILDQLEDKSPPPEPNKPNQSSVATNDGNRRPEGSNPFKLASILIGISLLGSLIWGFMKSNQHTQSTSDLNKLTEQYEQLETDCAKLQINNSHIAFLKDANTSPIVMAGTDKSPASSATVFWNPERKQAFLDTNNMPDVPTDKQYQLWAIVDGKPVDMGVFDLIKDDTIFIEVPFIAAPQAFAVTLEKAGGVPSPTMEEMYVLGSKS